MFRQLLCCFLALPLLSLGLPLLSVEPGTGKIVNTFGEEVMLHGVNVVYKLDPWIPWRDKWDSQLSFSKEDIKYLKDWGFNVVRLGVMWPGYDLGEQKTNLTYLQKMKDLVNELGDSGIYTLIDMHQDLLSEYYCGEGVPDYLAANLPHRKEFPWPLGDPPGTEKPDREFCKRWKLFGTYYTTRAINFGFEELYRKDSRLHKKIHEFWIEVAKVFKGNTNVLGYEFINEPYAGNLYTNPFNVLNFFCNAGPKTLEPLYHSLAEAVRKIDQDHIIVFESPLSCPFTNGFKKAPGGRANVSKQIYSYHVYCPLVTWSCCPRIPLFCELFDTVMFYLKYLEKKHFGSAALLTEFGALSNEPGCVEETHRLLSKAEAYGDGWMYWQYKQYNDPTTANMDGTQGFFSSVDNKPHMDKIDALTRPYARKVAGRLRRVRFDADDPRHTFDVEYDIGPALTNGTVTDLYVNLAYYGDKEPLLLLPPNVTCTASAVEHGVGKRKYVRYLVDHKELLKSDVSTIKIQMTSKS